MDMATKQRQAWSPTKDCLSCGKPFTTQCKRLTECPACLLAKRTITIQCEWCQRAFTYLYRGKKLEAQRPRRFCARRCKILAQRANPAIEAKWKAAMQDTWNNPPLKGIKRPEIAKRMRGHVVSTETRAKISQVLRAANRHHRPPAQGGNGRPVPAPQRLLAEKTCLPCEVVILTRPIRHLIEKLPYHYKADLADEERHLVIEIDGWTHSSAKGKIRDAKKDHALSLLGWTVLRFSNQEVMENITSVVERIQSFTT